MKTMMIFISALLIFVAAGSTTGSDLQLKNPVRITVEKIPTVMSSPKILRSKSTLMHSPGTILDSTYYDWQANGGHDDHIAMFSDGGDVGIKAVMTTAYLEDTSDRCLNYYNWDDMTWTNGCLFEERGGFGRISLFQGGEFAISTNGDFDGQGARAFAIIEEEVGVFRYLGTAPDPIGLWPRITVNSDSSIVIVAIRQDNNDVLWARAEDWNSVFGEWHSFRDIAPGWMGDDMEWPTIHSGTNGKVGVVIPDVAGAIRLFESTDNGITFDSLTVAPADTADLQAGLDSTAARLGWINSDITYIDDEPHVVWTAGQGAKFGGEYGLFDFKATIFHWSPSTGIDTVVVASTQSADPTRDDYVPTPWNHLSVDWPSIGLAVDGRTLVVAYTALSTEDIDSTAFPPTGYLDIWMATSPDNGETWTDPQNVTNPDGTVFGWDDRYPSVAKISLDNAADPGKDVYMIYQSDDLAGTFVQGVESSANMDYVKFLGVDLAAVGIRGDGDGESGPGLPRTASLSQNCPNPFNPSTTIDYQVADKSHVILGIYDIRGRLVKEIVDEEKGPGHYSVQWDGRDTSGRSAPSGIYLYRLETAGNLFSTKKMLLLK